MYSSFWQTSKAFLKSSFNFLKNNKDLLWIPAATLAFYALSMFVEFNYLFADSFKLAQSVSHTALYVSLGIMVLALLVVTNLLSCAFYVCTLNRLQNKPCTVTEGISESTRFIFKMLAWSSIKIVMDTIFHSIARLGRVGRILEIFMQVSWGILSMFVLPIMIMQNVGPITALKKSGTMIKKNWRKNFSMTFIFGLLTIAFVGLGYLLLGTNEILAVVGSTTIYVAMALFAVWFIALSFIMRPLLHITNSALYLFNSNQKEIAYFDSAVLQNAFSERQRRGLF